MIAKSLFIALFITSVPVLADTLVAGSVYFDSLQTLDEVIKLSAHRDNEGIAKLIADRHVSKQTAAGMDIVVLTSGATPEDPAEFHFLNDPSTYWTLTRNVTNSISPIPTSALAPTSSPTQEPTPLPAESPTPTPKHIQRRHESNAPFDDDNGQRIWHQVDGKWKWYLASKHHVLVKRALPVDAAPVVKP